VEGLLIFLVAGFFAQLIDGSLGMGFGVIGTSLMVAGGASAVTASAVINATKVGTALVSGAAHWRFGNVHWRTVLLIGVPGGVGAYAAATVLSENAGKDFAWVTALILLVLGIYMLARFAFGVTRRAADPGHLRPRFLIPLGITGGVINAIGGGGWGPVTTPTLMTVGKMEPRTAIGSVSLAELIVSAAASLGFFLHLGDEAVNWGQVGALMGGAVLVAPFAAWIVKVLPARVLGTFVAGLIVALNLRTIGLAAGVAGAAIAALVVATVALTAVLVYRSWGLARDERELLASSELIHDDRVELAAPHGSEPAAPVTPVVAADPR
jgi:uncharacterized membrane protein YfcA